MDAVVRPAGVFQNCLGHLGECPCQLLTGSDVIPDFMVVDFPVNDGFLGLGDFIVNNWMTGKDGKFLVYHRIYPRQSNPPNNFVRAVMEQYCSQITFVNFVLP